MIKKKKNLSYFSKLIFIILLALSIFIVKKYISNSSKFKKLTIALDLGVSLSNINPSRINVLAEAIVLRNLYSALFEYDEKGNIVTGLIKSFYWKNGVLKFDLITEPVLSNGKTISVNDVFFSLKRLMFLGNNLHGDLKEILCPDVQLNNINDDCPGIKAVGQTIEMKPISKAFGQQLIPLLATVDFRIIPRESINENSPFFPIVNFNVTSGPYFSTIYDERGNFNLRANLFHYKYSINMPQEVDVLSLNGNEATERFLNGTIDLISTSIPITYENFQKIEKSVNDLSVSKSFNLKIKAIFFGKKALEDFDTFERFILAKKLRVFYDKIVLPMEVQSNEFFQDFASGYLSTEQKNELQKLRDTASTSIDNFPRKASLAINRKSIDNWRSFLKQNKGFTPELIDKSVFHMKVENRPDVFAGVNDVTFNRSISVLSYNLKQGILGLYGDTAHDWFKKYLRANSSEHAIKILNELHYKALSTCAIYPLTASPFILLARNGWKAQMNPFFSATELWLLQKN
ncbi:MAG: hypothetical protein AABY64_01660 [Bdellovibrionota bacterium]